MVDNGNIEKGTPDLMIKLFELFPYPIQIFSRDGTSRMINDAALEMMGIKSRKLI